VNPSITDVQTLSTADSKLNIEAAYTVQFKLSCSNSVKVYTPRSILVLFNIHRCSLVFVIFRMPSSLLRSMAST
jgi:hypothetical protein